MRVLIYGAPGAGKSTASKLLHTQTGMLLSEGDYLREVRLPQEIGASPDPFLYVGTKQAWRHFGLLSPENAVKGLMAVRDSMRSYIDEELKKHIDVIFEAAFLDPTHYLKTDLYLVVTPDEQRHRQQFFEHRPKNEELNEGFRASRYIQDYLLKEAEKLGIAVISNAADTDGLLVQFKKSESAGS